MMREFMQSYLKENNVKIKDGADVNPIMQDMMFAILEGTLDDEMKQDLDYSKYDYRNKDTVNSYNGHSWKAMHAGSRDMQINVQRIGNREFNPELSRNIRMPLPKIWRKRSYPCYAKGMIAENHMK